MSCIEKMSIQGIRSFGPEDQDKGIILFFKPLTLILGPNGTGKTTVIECLKYMTTGVMPPGSKGGAFVQDPKIAREREVKGQIKLQFRDVMGQKMTIQRIMLVTQKLKKVEMRTLDGVITRLDATGEKKSISSKCAEIDREMITSLGVSKPVLENVIFCHQEESNWPLSEGKALKEKFDAIFASTRYVKALETIRKLKQTQDQDLKLYKQDSTYLKQHKDKASELEADLEEVQTKLMSSRDNIEKIDSKLTPIDEKLDQIATKSTKIYQIQTEITKLESERTIKQKAAEELKELIENEYQGSTSELRKELEEFGDAVQERQETIEQFQRKQAKLEKAIEKLTKEKNSLLMEVGKLEQEAERHKETVQRRDAHIRKVANDFHFEGFNRGEITEEKNKNFLDKIDHKVQRMADKARKAKAEFEEKELSLQRQIDKVREKKTKLEQSEKMKREMVTENMNKIKQINRKLSEAEASAGRLDQITRDLKRAEHDLATAEESVNVEHLKQEIKDLTQKKNTQDAQISELSGEMNRLHLQSNSRAELDMFKKDKTTKEENIRRLKAKQEDTISYLIGHMPEHNIRGELDDYIGKQSDSVKKLSVELQKSKTQLATKEAEKKMFGDSLKKKEEEFGNLTERISSVCGSQNFDEGLSVLQEKMSQTQDQRGSLLGAEHFFEKYVVALEKKDPCCPLCHREFDTEQEVKELIIDLKDKLRLVPSKLQKAEKDLKEFNTKYDDMMQLKPLKENIETLSETEIPELKNKVKKLNEQIKNLKTEIEDKQEDLQTKEQDENMAKQIQPDVVTMDRYQGEVKELAKKITTESSKLTGGDSSKTLKDVISEKEELQMQVDTMNKMLDNKRQKINDHSEEVQSLKESINILREDKLKIDSDLQQRFKLEEDKTTFLRENDGHEEEIAKAKKDLRPLQSQIEKLQREKEEASKEKEDSLENMKTEIDSVKNKATKVKNLNQDIQGYTQLGKANTLNDKREHLEQIKSTTAEKEEEQKEYSRNLDKLRNDLAATEKTERELTDNLRLRKQMEDIKKLKSQIQEEQEKLGGIDVKNMDRERKRLMTQQGELMMDKQSAEGRQRELQGQISMIKKELQTDIYKDANNKYRDKMIQMRTTELASSDLEKYYKALDKAIMSYHNMKMDEINKIIRELWRNTYRGNDIETIEIRSDEDEAGLMKTRRTYNYRVVMVKGDTALDMRGRCSAGQKVLASLIIRMALAETFCLNCGILALDEPTTNLDRENIESLAYALVEIIKSRSNQKNFQLVVITHDEDFVELLGRSDYVDEFFKVRKDQNGCSKLVKAKVEDIHSR